jgi:HEAT repeat protein
LVQLLRAPENEPLRNDERFARQLSRLLQEELESGSLDPDRIQLRSFLCRMLGELRGAEVLATLLQAAGTERDAREIEVRRSALEALAQIIARSPDVDPSTAPGLIDTLVDATRWNDAAGPPSAARHAQRATAAFALGVCSDERAQACLLNLLEDPSADVRFNAATGLARWGRFEAEPVLLEMLDPGFASTGETTSRAIAWRRQVVMRNALRSVEALWTADPAGGTARLREAVHRLTNYPEDPIVQQQALQTMQVVTAALP